MYNIKKKKAYKLKDNKDFLPITYTIQKIQYKFEI